MLIKCIQTVYRKLTHPQEKCTVVTVCTIMLFLLVGSTYVITSTVFADSSGSLEEFNFGIALPGEKCRVRSLSNWTQAEKWAWKNICENEIVNFNEYLNENLDPTNPDHDDRWADGRRTLRASFLNTILLYEPFRSTIPYRGARIEAAYIQGEFDLIDAVLERPLIFVNSIFSSRVNMRRLITLKSVAFNGSRFNGELDMGSASVGGSLLMRNCTNFNSVVLIGAKIDGHLSMDGSTFNGELNMNSISVGGSLLMRNVAKFNNVILIGAKIDGQLSMVGSTFNSELNMNSISIGSSLFMRNVAKFNNVDLRSATISNVINMSGSTFNGELVMDAISVGGSLYMNDVARFNNVVLNGAKIDGQLSMVGSTFNDELVMDSISVGDSLIMNDVASLNNVVLNGAKISGQLSMVGSTFNSELNMNGISVGTSLLMHDAARFNTVDLIGAKIDGQLSMASSTFNSELNMNGISVGTSLLMHDAARFNTVDLIGAKIGGQLSMAGSTFNSELNMNLISIGGSLLMSTDAKFNNVVLDGAKIDGDLNMFSSTFAGGLDMDLLSVGGSLFMNNAIYKNVKLAGAKIENIVDMRDANFKGELDMNSTLIGSSLIMSRTKFENMTNLTFLSVGSNLEIQGAVLRRLDLTGARIEQTLRLSRAGESNIEWKNYELEDETPQPPKLTLKNVKVDVLQDTEESWPDHLELELEGFTFNHLAGPGLNGQEMPHQRGSDWFVDWLKADETYSPQPYRQLAGVLRTAGLEEMANDILFASRERTRKESSSSVKGAILWVLKNVIGYGYGGRIFWALAWIGGFVAAGTLILYFSKERSRHYILRDRFVDCAFYSLDMILPLIHLRERHYYAVDLITWIKYYFYIHKIMGYILVFFVIAGLSGLTK